MARETANPVLVEATRGDMAESRHRGAVAVVDATGSAALTLGDVDAKIYPRSSIKPVQALALVESGAADRFNLEPRHIALACASHVSLPVHVETVAAWLAAIGLSGDDLECGAHPPSDDPAAHAMVAAGRPPTRIHNNCSGKHAGFLSVCMHEGIMPRGYVREDHPIMTRVAETVSEMAGEDIGGTARGIDGCGIPVIGMSLRGVALSLARMADPAGLADGRAEACRRVLAAMAAAPEMVRGPGHFDSAVIRAGGGAVLCKTGAEGVHVAALPHLGLGVALKIDDGASRASSVALGGALRRLGALDAETSTALLAHFAPAVTNWAGDEVGVLRASDLLEFS